MKRVVDKKKKHIPALGAIGYALPCQSCGGMGHVAGLGGGRQPCSMCRGSGVAPAGGTAPGGASGPSGAGAGGTGPA